MNLEKISSFEDQNNEIAKDIVLSVIENNPLLKEHLIENNKFENDHPRITEAIPLAKNLLKEYSEEEVEEKIFMHLLVKVETIEIKTENKFIKNNQKILNAIEYKNNLAKEIEDIKKSKDKDLISETIDKIKETLLEIYEFNGRDTKRIKQKLQSQIEYLEQ